MTNLQTAVEATDECRRSFEEWYVKDYGEKEYYKSNTKAQVWVAFQAAWNACQPEVVGSSEVVCPECDGAQGSPRLVQIGPGIRGVRACTNLFHSRKSVATAAEVPIPTVEELAEAMYQNNTALLTNVQARYIAKVVHKILTKGRGGA